MLFAVVVASPVGAKVVVRELPTSSPQKPTFVKLVAHATYRASLVKPTPTLSPSVRGWIGAQFVSHQHNNVRYETAWASWQNGQPCSPSSCSGQEVDIISGPAMTLSPAAAIARVHDKNWNFAPYQPPTPVQQSTIAGLPALYFDGTAPPASPEWAVVGANPPELKIARDHSFRMAAFKVRGKTVVVVIQAPATEFAQFLPIATRLVSSLHFPRS